MKAPSGADDERQNFPPEGNPIWVNPPGQNALLPLITGYETPVIPPITASTAYFYPPGGAHVFRTAWRGFDTNSTPIPTFLLRTLIYSLGITNEYIY
jgi:hypothetical protein